MLGPTSLERNTGSDQAEAIKHILNAWNVEEQSVAMCFDTTASNPGKFTGASILLEALLDHPLLWTACRHHVHEVILAHVFKRLFGNSSSPQRTIFELLKRKWPSLDFAADTTHNNTSFFQMDSEDMSSAEKTLHKIKYDNASCVPRDDYAEFLDLVIFYLKKDSLGTFRLRRPGAQHRARWISSATYTLKMLLLQTQLDIDPEILKPLELFGYAPS